MSSTPRFPLDLTLPLLACAALALPPIASAQTNPWSRRSVGGGATFTGLSTPDGDNVFVSGFSLDMNSWFAPVKPSIFVSTNGGMSFRDITGTAGAATSHPPHAIHFLDGATGWVALGKDVFRTDDGGATWTKATAPGVVRTLYFHDSQHGVAGGDGGAIYVTSDGGALWTAVTSTATSVLRHQFWVGDRLGWMLGHDESEQEGEIGKPSKPVVLRTTDGGASWSAATTLPAVQGLDSVFFLRDGKIGFVAGYTWSDDDSRDAVLLKSTDGGATFSVLDLPIEVGQLDIGFGDFPIQASHVRAMYWEDEERGHLAGIAFLVKSGSGGSGGGSGQKIHWRVVDYVTDDGGETWAKTDLGTITGSIFNLPSGDGWVGAGVLRDLHNGWMAAEGGQIWLHTRTCSADDDCGNDYACNEEKRCERQVQPGDACLPACGEGQACVEGSCVLPNGGGGGDGTGKPDGGGDGDDHPSGGSRDTGGCDCSSAPVTGAGLLLLGLLGRRRGVRRNRG